MYASISRLSQRSTQRAQLPKLFRFISGTQKRCAAKARPSKPAPASTPKSLPTVSAHAAARSRSPKLHGLEVARRLYDSGVRDIYEAPSHMSWTVVSWCIGIALIGGSANLMLIGNWKPHNLKGMGNWQKAFVSFGNHASMIFMTTLGGWAIFRYAGFVRSIRLVDLGRGNIGMNVSVRRRTPISKTEYTVEPCAITMPKDWKLKYATETTREDNTPAVIATKPFRWFKDFFLMRGIVAPVHVREGNETGFTMLDPRGIEISVRDWDILTREAVA